jgi:hypothetical protein
MEIKPSPLAMPSPPTPLPNAEYRWERGEDAALGAEYRWERGIR